MIEKLAQTLVAWQMERNYLKEKDRGLYTYAYELLLGQTVNFLIACILAVVFHAYLTVFIFLVAYIPLRSYAGGHHAETSGICTVVSAAILCVVCAVAKLIPLQSFIWVSLAAWAISGFMIFPLRRWKATADRWMSKKESVTGNAAGGYGWLRR